MERRRGNFLPPVQNVTAPEHHGTVDFVCGSGAAFINIFVTFPLNKVMFRQQMYGITIGKSLGQLQKEGIWNLYRGLLPPLLQKTASLAIMFGMYEEYQILINRHAPQVPELLNKGTAAFLAGSTECILAPFERVQVIMQDRTFMEKYRNTYCAFKELRPYGLKEYYRGLTFVLLRNGPSNIMFFLGRGELAKLFPKAENAQTQIRNDFVCGAVLGAFISTCFFPLNVVKTKIQSNVGGPFLSIKEGSKVVFEERKGSWRKIFRGSQVNFTRSLISWGIINASYEYLKTFYS